MEIGTEHTMKIGTYIDGVFVHDGPSPAEGERDRARDFAATVEETLASVEADLGRARRLLMGAYTDFGFHHELARVLDVDHGDAVRRARTVCASGNGAGAHGFTSPCDECTTNAVRSLAREQARQ